MMPETVITRRLKHQVLMGYSAIVPGADILTRLKHLLYVKLTTFTSTRSMKAGSLSERKENEVNIYLQDQNEFYFDDDDIERTVTFEDEVYGIGKSSFKVLYVAVDGVGN